MVHPVANNSIVACSLLICLTVSGCSSSSSSVPPSTLADDATSGEVIDPSGSDESAVIDAPSIEEPSVEESPVEETPGEEPPVAEASVVEAPVVENFPVLLPMPELFEFIPKLPAIPTLINTEIHTPLSYLETRKLDVPWGRTTRISSEEAFNGFANHFYSRRQPWNADETLLDVGNRVISSTDYSTVAPEIALSSERDWSNRDPESMYGLYWNDDKFNILAKYNVLSGELSGIHEFVGYRNCTMGGGEGTLSADDNYVVVSCTNNEGGDRNGSIQIFNYDLYARKVISSITAEPNYNWASISPSGNYIVVENNTFPDPSPEIYVYDKNFANKRYLGGPAHGDFGTDVDGNEVYVQANRSYYTFINLSSLNEYTVWVSSEENPSGYGHLSCRNTLRPGWCYVSSRNRDLLGAFKVSSSESVFESWGRHRSSYSSYRAEPKIVPNRRGTKIIFSSDWHSQIGSSDFITAIDSNSE